MEEETQVARLTQAVEDGYEIDVRASNVVSIEENAKMSFIKIIFL